MDILHICLKVFLGIICSGLIGMERQYKNRPAGVKTHIMVCLGSVAIMILSELMFEKYYALYQITTDPMRLAAQVISGIGFLGAGTIMRQGASVKGLTTAATLWVVSAIGLSIGAGFYLLAIIFTGAILATFASVNYITKRNKSSEKSLEMKVEIKNEPEILGKIQMTFVEFHHRISEMEMRQASEVDLVDLLDGEEEQEDILMLYFHLRIPVEDHYYTILRKIEQIPGVIHVERI